MNLRIEDQRLVNMYVGQRCLFKVRSGLKVKNFLWKRSLYFVLLISQYQITNVTECPLKYRVVCDQINNCRSCATFRDCIWHKRSKTCKYREGQHWIGGYLKKVYLTFYLTIPTFNDLEKVVFRKHCWKRRKCW